MKNTCTEEKYASIYEINMLRCIFCGLCEDACPKDALFDYLKNTCSISYEREDFIWEG
jgi:NADH-quinone oxidoreductase subunit I